MTALDNQHKQSDGRAAGAADPARSLIMAAGAVLRHPLSLPEEDKAAQMLRAMGVPAPTGADALLLGQYLKALRGETSAAKFVRDAALEQFEEETEETRPELDLRALSDEALYAIAAEAEP